MLSLACTKPLVQSLALHNWECGAPCKPSTLKVEAGDSELQSHVRLLREFTQRSCPLLPLRKLGIQLQCRVLPQHAKSPGLGARGDTSLGLRMVVDPCKPSTQEADEEHNGFKALPERTVKTSVSKSNKTNKQKFQERIIFDLQLLSMTIYSVHDNCDPDGSIMIKFLGS